MRTLSDWEQSKDEWQILVKREDQEKELLQVIGSRSEADAIADSLRGVYGSSALIITREIK